MLEDLGVATLNSAQLGAHPFPSKKKPLEQSLDKFWSPGPGLRIMEEFWSPGPGLGIMEEFPTLTRVYCSYQL